MSNRRKSAILAAMFVVAAIAFGGGYWLHQQRQERAWSVLLDTLRRNKDEVGYSDASYSLFSQTLTVRDLRVSARDKKRDRGADVAAPAGDVASAPPLFQADTLLLTGADYLGQRGDPATLTRFEKLEVGNPVLFLPAGTLRADKLSAGPASENTAALNALDRPASQVTDADVEKAMNSISVRNILLTGASLELSGSSGKISADELRLDSFGLQNTGPLLISGMEWKPGPPASGSFQPVYFTGMTAKSLAFENFRLPSLNTLAKLGAPLSGSSAQEVNREWLMQEFGLKGLRGQDILLRYSLTEVRLREAELSVEQKNGVSHLRGAMNGLAFDRMVNFLLLKAVPELSAIPDAANLPLSLSSNVDIVTRWLAPDVGATVSMEYALQDIATLRVDADFESLSMDEMLARARTGGQTGGTLQVPSPLGSEYITGVRSMTFTLADQKLLEYCYKILATKTGSSPEELRASLFPRLQQRTASPGNEADAWMAQPAMGEFLKHSGTLRMHLAARNGTVPMQRLSGPFDPSLFIITMEHTPSAPKTP